MLVPLYLLNFSSQFSNLSFDHGLLLLGCLGNNVTDGLLDRGKGLLHVLPNHLNTPFLILSLGRDNLLLPIDRLIDLILFLIMLPDNGRVPFFSFPFNLLQLLLEGWKGAKKCKVVHFFL